MAGAAGQWQPAGNNASALGVPASTQAQLAVQQQSLMQQLQQVTHQMMLNSGPQVRSCHVNGSFGWCLIDFDQYCCSS